MEASQPLSIESFSYSWLINLKPSFESLDDSLRTSLDVSDEASFIEMDPRMPPSKRFFRNSQDFNFDFPISQPPLSLVHADELFSNGLIMPIFMEPLKMEAYDGSYSLPATPISSSHAPKHVLSATNTRCSSLRRCRRLSKQILQKYLDFLRPLYRRIRGRRIGSRAESVNSRMQEGKSWGPIPTMSQTTTKPHVAVLAFPFSTHAAPLLAVVRRLAAAAPHAVFSFFSTSQSNASIFHDSMHTMQCNIKSYDVSDGVAEGYVFAGRPQEDIELFMRAAPESFRQGMVMAVAETGRPVSCLVADAFIWFAADMAAEMGVAWLPFWTSGPNSLSTHVYTDEIREKIAVSGIQGREDELLNFIPGMSKVRFRDLQEGIVFGNLNSLFSRMLHRMGQVLPKATAVFINSFEELDDSLTNDLKSKLKTYLNIGPFNLITPPPVVPNTTGCLQWLKERKPTSVVYISFGTVTTPPPAELVALAEALEASRVPFIWSLRDKARVHLPEGFLEKTRGHGMVVPWAPQAEVLAHEAVGAFVTHCGWNSLWESVAGGVPLICRPFFGDQRLNGRMVEDALEIGVRIEGGVFTKSGLMSCFDQILSQEKGKKLRENLRALRETADRAVGPKGSSTENFKTLVDLVSKPKDV